MRIASFLLLCALAVPVGLSAKPPEPLQFMGLYGNVYTSRQTGDLGGQEIRFFNDPASAKPMIEFVDCEGWCNQTYTVPLMKDNVGFWFEYAEDLNDGAGNVTKGDVRRYRLSRKGRNIILSGAFPTCAECEPLGPYKLKPLKRSFGIAVANQEP
jgi:hypothetical protein